MKARPVKPTSYYRKGKLIQRKGFDRKITPKHKRAAKKNLQKARTKWSRTSPIQRKRKLSWNGLVNNVKKPQSKIKPLKWRKK